MFRRQEDYSRVVLSAKRKRQKPADRPTRYQRISVAQPTIPLVGTSLSDNRPFWSHYRAYSRRLPFDIANLLPKVGNAIELSSESVETAVELIRDAVLLQPDMLQQLAPIVLHTYAHPIHQASAKFPRRMHFTSPTPGGYTFGKAASTSVTPLSHAHLEGCRCLKCCVYSNPRITVLIQNWARLWLATFLRHARLSHAISDVRDVCSVKVTLSGTSFY